MGCHTSKSNKLEDKISQVIIIYSGILNEIREKRQQYLGKCGDIEDDEDLNRGNNNNNNLIADFDFSKKQTFQTQISNGGLPNNPISYRSAAMFTSKKSLEQAELHRKSTKADVWRFSNRNSFEQQQDNNNIKGLPNKSILKSEDFAQYMFFLKNISNKFEKINQKQLDLIESYYNSDKKDIQIEIKRLHNKIESAQKKKTQVENCLNKILNKEQFTSLPDGYVVANHY
ncbi:hypothetical protein ABPG72_000820 [Tetrahymena utriculariae]